MTWWDRMPWSYVFECWILITMYLYCCTVLCTKYCSYDLTHNDSLKHTTSTSIWGNRGTAMLGNLFKVVSPVRTGSKLGIQAVWLRSPHPWGPHSSPMLISTCLSTKTEGSVLLKYSSGHKPEAVFIIWFATILPPCLVPAAAATAKSCQSCPTLCDPIDGSPQGSHIPGILQARTLEWVAISFSNAWKWKVKVKSLSCVWLFTTPWTAAYQIPLPMGFSRQEYWIGVPFHSLK